MSAFFCATVEPLLELLADGGGDFNRGEMGHCGVMSPELGPPTFFADLGSRETGSAAAPDCN